MIRLNPKTLKFEIACDECGKRITKQQKANVYSDSGGQYFIVHKFLHPGSQVHNHEYYQPLEVFMDELLTSLPKHYMDSRTSF
jgi:hypothetical protein